MNKIIKLNEEEKQILNIYSKLNNEEIDLENIILEEYKIAEKKKSQVFYNKQEEEFLTIYYIDKEIKGYKFELKKPTRLNNFFNLKNILENVKETITIDTFLNNLPSYTKKISFEKNVVYYRDTDNFSFENGCSFQIEDKNNNFYLFVFDENNKFKGFGKVFPNKEEFSFKKINENEMIISKIFPKYKTMKYAETITINKDKELELLKCMYKERVGLIYPPFSLLKFNKDKDKNFFNNKPSVFIDKTNENDYLKFENGLVPKYFFENGKELSKDLVQEYMEILKGERIDYFQIENRIKSFLRKQIQYEKIENVDFFKDKELNEIFKKYLSFKKIDKNVLQL